MHKWRKRILGVLVCLVGILFIMACYHHIKLWTEKKSLEQVGTLVTVDGYQMNVYTEGVKKQETDPTVVLLSGSGVCSPIYDYKVLYSKLTSDYAVAVVEKFGYGYSDICSISRDVATMVEEDRKALQEAGVKAPYVLMPHSMSALEAIYWAYHYPEEVAGLVGLDMAVPDSYQVSNLTNITLMKASVFFGFHRISVFNPVSSLGLTEDEYRQNQLLNYRNALNKAVYNECKIVMDNAKATAELYISKIPTLMFTTSLGGGEDETQWSEHQDTWVTAQNEFAKKQENCKQLFYGCGHNLHYEKSYEMAVEILEFLNNLENEFAFS